MSRSEFVLGIIFTFLMAADYLAIARLPIAVAIVLIFTSPVFVVAWNAIASKRFPLYEVSIALILTVIGVVLVSDLLETNLTNFNWFGLLVGLTTGMLFALYTVVSERVGNTENKSATLLKTFFVSSLFWLGFFVTQGLPSTVFESQYLPKVIYLATAGTILPYLLYLWGVQHLQAQQSAIIATIEPVIAATIAWIWFGQSLSVMQIVGGVLILTAITFYRLKKPS